MKKTIWPFGFFIFVSLSVVFASVPALAIAPNEYAGMHWRLIGPFHMAPSLSAANITAPLLMNAPDSEYLGGLPQYWEMRDRGKPVEMYVFPHETHVKMERVHRLVIYNRNLDWYKYWLMNKRDPDPAKRGQYRRWDQLRKQLAAEQIRSSRFAKDYLATKPFTRTPK